MLVNRKQPSWGISIPGFCSAFLPMDTFISHLEPSHTLKRMELAADHLQIPSSRSTGDLLLLCFSKGCVEPS